MTGGVRPRAASARARRPRPGRLALALVLVVGTLTAAPALTTGLLLDDHVHRAILEGRFPAERAPWELYDFVADDDREVLREVGLVPWWAHPRFTMRFLRPVSSLLRAADHAAFGPAAFPAHLHSLAWWVIAVLAARSLFARWLRPRATTIATAVYALSPAHATSLAWLAHRHSLVAVALGTLGLVAYLRWRDRRRIADGALATVLFSLALGGGETAIGLAGFVVALEATRRHEDLVRRVTGALPFAAPLFAYLAVRTALGYGTIGSTYYVDPITETAAFLDGAPERLEWLLFDAWAVVAAALEDAGRAMVWARAAAIVLCALFVALVVPTGRRLLGAPDGRPLLALMVGSTLALVPALAVPQATRLLELTMLGVAPVVGVVIDRATSSTVWSRDRARAVVLAVLALGLTNAHFVRATTATWVVGSAARNLSFAFDAHSTSVAERVAAARPDAAIILGSGGDALFVPAAVTGPRFVLLAQSTHLLLRHTAPRTIELTANFGTSVFPVHGFFGDVTGRLRVGETFEVRGMRATILAVAPGRVVAVRFDFDEELDGALWLNEQALSYEVTEIPPEGFGAAYELEIGELSPDLFRSR